MRRGSTDLVLLCLDDIRTGRRTLAACVEQYPELAAELRSLAPVASELRAPETPALDPAAKGRVRNQLLAAISSNGHHPAEDRHMLASLRPLWWRPRWLVAIGGAVAALAAGGAVVYAAQGAPPQSPLYPVRTAVQVVAHAVTPPQPTPTAVPSPTPVPAKPESDTVVLPLPRVPAPAPSVGVVRNGEASAPPGQQRGSPEPDRNRGRDRDQSPAPTPSVVPTRGNQGNGPSQRNPDPRGNGSDNQAGNGDQGNGAGQGNARGAADKPGDPRGGGERHLLVPVTSSAPARGEADGRDNDSRGDAKDRRS